MFEFVINYIHTDFLKTKFDVTFETDKGLFEDTIFIRKEPELIWLGDRHAEIDSHCGNICDEKYVNHPKVEIPGSYYPIKVNYQYHDTTYCRCFPKRDSVDIIVYEYESENKVSEQNLNW